MTKKTLRTTPALMEFIANNAGIPDSILGNMLRRIREDGFASQKGRGRSAAQATSHDAAMLLLVSMATNRPVHAGVVAEALTTLRLDESDPDDLPQDVNGLQVKSRDALGVVTEIIDDLRIGAKSLRGPVQLRLNSALYLDICWDGDCWQFKPPQTGKGIERFKRIMQRGPSASKRSGSGCGLVRYSETPNWMLENIADWLEGRETE